jgi:glycine/D-amino acid oxidase-like deaminating enzyme
VGGAHLFDTYASEETHNNKRMARALDAYINTKFPGLKTSLEYIWPGMIGVSKDLFPIAGFDENRSSIYYITAATGLPWAAALGAYSAEHVLNNDTRFAEYFSPYRSFKINAFATKLFGHKLTFALSHYMTASSF